MTAIFAGIDEVNSDGIAICTGCCTLMFAGTAGMLVVMLQLSLKRSAKRKIEREKHNPDAFDQNIPPDTK
jgi:hypothetical protein